MKFRAEKKIVCRVSQFFARNLHTCVCVCGSLLGCDCVMSRHVMLRRVVTLEH